MKRCLESNGKKRLQDESDEQDICDDCCCDRDFPELSNFKMIGKFEGKIKFFNGNFEFDGKFDGTVESNQNEVLPEGEECNSEELESAKKKLLGSSDQLPHSSKEEEEEEALSVASDDSSEEEKPNKKHYDAAKLQNPPTAEDCKTQ
ncbi:hypothetical protein EHI8A_091500 [Entamoeba histolytica HM-1:IMSS-B]|uniref:Uncharacterized protein n=5 Tax=Entamoeba histolytica TaxID=5759 RepID=C4LVV1_ENTH1|nr:hypothetical protein EHI_125630 [Entamoeba histolytica HM-1:IMSS]EMD45181.1 Hypothetical protein EHI5A_045410 [Entamoeba histolytica KU27]EMH75956.1 hypothetical protein EHI8A_091500 [Entamoeba histolytica HM-1:IMSS-B]ENY61836.1 hypothetical protein EHI7A_033600 [Entamoeba histolytica HM-1:IMSS-A]GAT92807.1 hypothetical protein CL6EHI_125630 [Entamoeba histolytica]EAL51128.1 hypothetical protein EHI_125630 [Entamoeba histolytica HM-1:IMSS]|eukprot:XP_656515.1 hypothetical protein EHI_125630 [Entamoeba histolytica HM-1:IMSS]